VERRAVKVAGAQVEERAAVEETANAGVPHAAAAAAPGVARDVVRGAAPALPRQKPDKTPE
jgi:hypothetical protein